jgi:hypothetical protein
LKELFARVARPFAEPGLPGAWFRGRRVVSLDGTTIDLPDTPELEERFGRPGASRGTSMHSDKQDERGATNKMRG